jgi:hypothetical protein
MRGYGDDKVIHRLAHSPIRYSSFAIRYSQFVIRYSIFGGL